MPRVTALLSSNQPDPRILQIVSGIRRLCLSLILSISIFSFATFPPSPLRHLLPFSWQRMPLAVALCCLLSALSLHLAANRRSLRSRRIRQALAILILLIAGSSAAHSLLTPGSDPATPQAAFAFLLLGTLLLCFRTTRPILSECVDAFTVFTCTVTMILFYSFTLGALNLINVSFQTRIPPAAVLCITLLTLVAFNLRAEHGIFSVLLNPSIAGKTARLASPFALGLPVIRSMSHGLIHTEHVTALASISAFSLILIICVRIHRLEREIRDLSLRDELTGLYNRRGFNILAEQAHRLARRAGNPFSVVFIDLDNLKQINDACGHKAGSDLLRNMACILRATFRETDVIARVGGDEFVIAGKADSDDIAFAIRRLYASADLCNRNRSNTYKLSFSLGHTTTDHVVAHSLEDMLQHADGSMYQSKRRRKASSVALAIDAESAPPYATA